jgi:hypothetical protein
MGFSSIIFRILVSMLDPHDSSVVTQFPPLAVWSTGSWFGRHEGFVNGASWDFDDLNFSGLILDLDDSKALARYRMSISLPRTSIPLAMDPMDFHSWGFFFHKVRRFRFVGYQEKIQVRWFWFDSGSCRGDGVAAVHWSLLQTFSLADDCNRRAISFHVSDAHAIQIV